MQRGPPGVIGAGRMFSTPDHALGMRSIESEDPMNQLLPFEEIWAAIAGSPLATLAALFLIATAASELAVRLLRLPRYTALVLAGLVLAAIAQNFADARLVPLLGRALEAVAMLMLFEVGQRISFEWLRRNPWLLVGSLVESAAAFWAIYALLRLVFGVEPPAAALVAVICMASSPIAVLAVSKDLRSRGQVTERALLFSTLSTAYAALVLQLVITGALASGGLELGLVMQPIYQLCASFLLGTVAAAVLLLFVRAVPSRGAVQVMAVAALCGLIYVIAWPLSLSPLLAAMAFGLVARGLDKHRRIASFETSEAGALLAIAFFALTGAALHWQLSALAWGIAIAVVAVRVAVKIGAATLLAPPSGLAPAKGMLVGLAQAPLSGVALMFATHVAISYPTLVRAVELVFAVITILAIIGPIATEIALRRAKENTCTGDHSAWGTR